MQREGTREHREKVPFKNRGVGSFQEHELQFFSVLVNVRTHLIYVMITPAQSSRPLSPTHTVCSLCKEISRNQQHMHAGNRNASSFPSAIDF